MEYDEEDDYGQEQMESTGMNGQGMGEAMDDEYDQEEESPDGEGEDEYGEESNANPYPKQNPPNGGLEERLEQIKNNIKSQKMETLG